MILSVYNICFYLTDVTTHQKLIKCSDSDDNNVTGRKILVIDQFLFYNKFIIFLYMFRALLCSKHVEEYNKLIIK